MTVHHDLIAQGVWWLRGTRGSNVYLVEAIDGQLLIVDSGFADSATGIIEAVADVAPGRQVSQILLTHAHSDHVGAAMELRQWLGATVAAGRADCVEDAGTGPCESQLVLATHTRGRGMFARSANGATNAVVVDHPLNGEVEIAPGILAVPTPGHTPGSYCYVDATRSVAFVGDLVISHRDSLARPLPFTNADDARYLASMREFAANASSMGCVGHGEPIMEGFGRPAGGSRRAAASQPALSRAPRQPDAQAEDIRTQSLPEASLTVARCAVVTSDPVGGSGAFVRRSLLAPAGHRDAATCSPR